MHSLTFVALEQRGSYRSARCAFTAQEWQKDLGGPEMEAIVVTTFTNWVRRRQRHWHSWKERKSWEANEGDQKKAEWLRLASHVGVSGKAANLLSIRLVRQFLRRTGFRGSDVRLDLGLIWRLDAVARKTINPETMGMASGSGLELEKGESTSIYLNCAILRGLEWRAQTKRFCSCRFLHLADSQICLAVLCKGTSSSRINRILRKSAHCA